MADAPPASSPVAPPASSSEELTKKLDDLDFYDGDVPTPAANKGKAKAAAPAAAAEAPSAPSASAVALKSLLVDVDEAKLVIDLADASHPQHVATTFEDLGKIPDTVPIPESVMKAIKELGFTRPSPIQAKALPLLLRIPQKSASNPTGRPENMIFQSQAGTGKTGAFAIDILSRCDPRLKSPQAFILCPTYLLADQTAKVMQTFAKHTGMEVALVYGANENRDKDKDAAKAAAPPRVEKVTAQIVVGTVGKIANDIQKPPARAPYTAKDLRVCVIDEADNLFNMNFKEPTMTILKRLPDQCQTILLSATFPEDVFDFAKSQVKQPVNVITLPREEQSLDNVKQMYVMCRDDADKFTAIETLYENIQVGQTVIFCQRRDAAHALKDDMFKNGHKVAVITSGEEMTKAQQDVAMQRFRNGEDRVLITTNILALGIDVVQISLVINYDPPLKKVMRDRSAVFVADPALYLQRIGRCGRMGRKGTAISLITPKEMKHIDEFSKFYSKPIVELDLKDADNIQKNVENK